MEEINSLPLINNVGAIGGVATAFIFAFAAYRAGSFHVVINRLWRFINGPSGVVDEKIRLFLESQSDLMQFRFISGIRVGTIDGARNLIDFANKHGILIDEIYTAGRHFDPNKLTVKYGGLPSKTYQSIKLICAILIALTASPAPVLIASPVAWLSFKDSGTDFGLTSTYAKKMWSLSSKKITVGACDSDKNVNDYEFSEKEFKIICEALKDPDSKNLVTSTLKSQRASLAVIFALGVWSLWMIGRSARRGRVAIKIGAVLSKEHGS
jgi:hypothetical protein